MCFIYKGDNLFLRPPRQGETEGELHNPWDLSVLRDQC